MTNRIGLLTVCAVVLTMSRTAPLSAEAPPPGTISVETRAIGPDLGAAIPAFASAIDDALAAKGFTVIEGAGHAGLIAYFHLVRTEVGSTMAKVSVEKASAGAGGSEGVGASMRLSLPTRKLRDAPLQQTRLEIAIERRGGDGILWQGAAVTVRPADTRDGRDAVVAANLAEIILRNYPAQATEAVSIP